MTATNHALTGAVIALAINEPWLAIPLALLSHFMLDAVPHYGPRRFDFSKFKFFLAGDACLALLALLTICLLFPAKAWLIFVCMTVAVIPDLVWVFYIKALERRQYQSLDPVTRLHQALQWKEFPEGIYVELVWAPLMILFIGLMK